MDTSVELFEMPVNSGLATRRVAGYTRVTPGDYVYHVLDRGVGRRRLFDYPQPRARGPEPCTYQTNEPQHETELQTLRKCVARGQPFGSASWVTVTAAELGLQFTLRGRGRPPKPKETKPAG